MSKIPSIIVFSTQYMPTGGIESHLREFCYHMNKSGVEIDLFILNSKMLPETEQFFKENCRNVFLCKNGRSLSRIVWLLIKGVLISGNRYDALYTNGQGESIILFSKFVNPLYKWVHHHHTSGDENDQKTWGKGYKRVIGSADTIIACSSINARSIEATTTRFIDNIPCFSREVSVGMPEKGDVLKFGYYGRLISEKGIDLLCALTNDKELKGIEIHIWGEGENYPSSFFSAFPNVHFHGAFFGKDELSRIIGELDAYLLITNNPEGLPIALLEVMSAGLPWLSTDKGGIPDIACDPLSTRIIPASSSYDEVKAAVLDLAADINNGEINRELQRDLYKKMFSSPVLVNRWREVLGLNTSY